MSGPCMCGDPYCPSCGSAMGTYPPPPESLNKDHVEALMQELRIIDPSASTPEALRRIGEDANDVIAWLIDRLDAEGISPYEEE